VKILLNLCIPHVRLRQVTIFFRGIYSANQKLHSSLLTNVTVCRIHITAQPFPVKAVSKDTHSNTKPGNSLAKDLHRDIYPLFSTTSPMGHVSTRLQPNCLLFMSKRILAGGTAEPSYSLVLVANQGFSCRQGRESQK
jgi:hypothetical protein